MVKRVVTEYDPVDLEQYERKSAMIWATRNVRLAKNMPWDFEHRVWQTKIFDDSSRELVVIKPTQIGMTTIMLCKMLHFATYNDVRVMYTLPRQDDVFDLMNGRVDTMFRDSPNILSRLGSVDNIRLKSYGKSFIHFMESSVPPRMLDVDCLINDEVDLSNQDHLEQYKARLDASQHKIHWKISTPSIPGFGIHKEYEQTNKQVWLVRCPRCNEDQELDWDFNVRHTNGETWYCCSKCDKTFSREVIQQGRWVAQFPGREINGYSVSQLMVSSIDPNSLWADSKNMRMKNFYNLRLGRPYAQATGAITRTLVYDKCLNETHHKEHSGNGYFLGADQGNDIHVAIGKIDGDALKIVFLEVIPIEKGFDRLHELMRIYKIKKAVVDALPNRHSSNTFTKEYSGRRAVAAFYSQIDDTYKEDGNELKVDINRSVSMDYLYDKIQSGELQLYGSRSNLTSELRLAVNHLTSLRRTEVTTTTRIGGEKVEVAWVNTGPDHFAHAINYLIVASDLGGYDRGFRALNIGKMAQEEFENKERRNNNPYVLGQNHLANTLDRALASSSGFGRRIGR